MDRLRYVVLLSIITFLFVISSNSSLHPSLANSPDTSETYSGCSGKIQGLIEGIEKRGKELDLREEKIQKEEERLKGLRLEIKKEIAALSTERVRLEKVLKDLEVARNKGLKNLAKIYENMPPEEAATRLERLNKDIAINLIKVMNSRTAGKILGFVEPARAAELTVMIGRRYISKKGM